MSDDALDNAGGENPDGKGAGDDAAAQPGAGEQPADGEEQPGKTGKEKDPEPIGSGELDEFTPKPGEKKPAEQEGQTQQDKDQEASAKQLHNELSTGLKRAYDAGKDVEDLDERKKAVLEAIQKEPEHVRGRLEKIVRGEATLEPLTATEKKEGPKPQTQEDIDKMVEKSTAKVADKKEFEALLPEILKAAKIDVKTADAKIKRTALAAEAARLETDHNHTRCDALRMAAASLELLTSKAVEEALNEGVQLGLKSQLPKGKQATAPKKDPDAKGDYKSMSDEDIIKFGERMENSN